MDVFGKSGPSAVFSDAVIYRFRIRPVDIAATGPEAAFAPTQSEIIFDCVFDIPSGDGGASRPVQYGRCLTPDGRTISFRADDENGGVDDGVEVFAGQRSEPFFLDVRMIEKTVVTGKLSFKPKGFDTLYGTNILAIVIKFDWRKMLKGISSSRSMSTAETVRRSTMASMRQSHGRRRRFRTSRRLTRRKVAQHDGLIRNFRA
jgi:hypothetical protein